MLPKNLRLLLSCLCLTHALSVQAQTSAPTPATPLKLEQDIVELPQFTVVGGEDGWTAANTMAGTRTNRAIADLPRSIQVLTSEFLEDIGATDLADAAAYMTGVTVQGKQDSSIDSNTFTIRGMRQNRHYRDGVREAFISMLTDSATFDRVEVLRGPNSVLAGVTEPGGMINQISKRPKSKDETSIKVSTGSWNYLRTEIDTSKKVTKNLSIRAVGATQSQNYWRPWEGSDRLVGFFAASYKLSPNTLINTRAEMIDYDATLAPGGNSIRIPNTTSATSSTSTPAVGGYGYGEIPESILPWDFNPYGPNSGRNQEVYRISADIQHKINDTYSTRAAISWSKSDREDLRLSGGANSIITRFLNPALGAVEGNVVPDEIRWSATKDDETWDIWSYTSDLRGAYKYGKIKHEAILGAELFESRQWRTRYDTPNTTSNNLGAAASTNPAALTRYKFPTASVGALAADAFQPAWTQMLDLSRYTQPNQFIDSAVTRYAFSLTNVLSTENDQWHALLGLRDDHGKTDSKTSSTSPSALVPQVFPVEKAISKTIGVVYRPIPAFSLYGSFSTSFSGVPTGIDVYGNLLTKPESGESVEGGFKSVFFNGKLSFEGAIFQLDRKNSRRNLTTAEIISILGYDPGVSGNLSTQDRGESSKGYETSILYRPIKAYQVAISFSYINATLVQPENVILNGSPITNRPRSSGSVVQKYTFQDGVLKGLSLTSGTSWVDGFRPDNVSATTGLVTAYIPGYVRFDFGAAYKRKFFGRDCTLSTNVSNATDEKYWSGSSSKGNMRSYRFGLSTKF